MRLFQGYDDDSKKEGILFTTDEGVAVDVVELLICEIFESERETNILGSDKCDRTTSFNKTNGTYNLDSSFNFVVSRPDERRISKALPDEGEGFLGRTIHDLKMTETGQRMV